MIKLSDRQQKIISIITQNNEPVSCRQISKEIGFSRRTVLSDISSINAHIPLIHSNNRGYVVDRTQLSKMNVEEIKNINEEHILLRRLVMLSKTYTFSELAEKQFVSESTLDRMLKSLSPLLASFNLSIKREKGFVKVIGDEFSKRKLINHLISEEIDPTFTSLDNISNLFQSLNISRIKAIIDQAISNLNYYVDKNYSFNLYLNIIIALYRMKSDIYIEEIPQNTIEPMSTEYMIAKEICTQYSSHWQINPQEEDIVYIALLLVGQIKPLDRSNNTHLLRNEIIPQSLITTMDNILFETFNYYMMTVHYKDFLYNFSLHVDAMIKRIKNNQIVSNDLLNNVKKNCPFIYEVAVHIAQKIQKTYNITIPDEEIGFISIHIGFLINSSVDNYNKIKILLLCNDYHQILTHIKDKILRNHSEYVEIITHDFSFLSEETDFNNIDLIITTKLLNIIGKKTVIITPFYSIMDHMQVDNAIHAAILEKEVSYKNRLLSSFFHENLFFKTNNYPNKNQAIKFMGDKIIEFGLAPEGFTESVLAREKLSSTCFFDTFAIPHSLDMTTKRSMFCVLISEKGIDWDGKLIHIVLMLAIQMNDRKEFMNIYNAIIKALWSKEKTNSLIKSSNLMEFLNNLK